MDFEEYFYNCSKEYLYSISKEIYTQITGIIKCLPKRQTQAEINKDLFWLFGSYGWSYDTIPPNTPPLSPVDLCLNNILKDQLVDRNVRDLCKTSTTIDTQWYSDFAKMFNGKLVQAEAQFGKTELLFKDLLGFRIAYYERRLHLGIEIVISKPNQYFAHRKKAISGMAYFDIAKKTLGAIGLDCPIWLIGITL